MLYRGNTVQRQFWFQMTEIAWRESKYEITNLKNESNSPERQHTRGFWMKPVEASINQIKIVTSMKHFVYL